MIKKYVLQNEFKESIVGWQIISHSSENVQIKLKGESGRLYFCGNVSGNFAGLPNLQKADICEDTNLALTFICDKEISLLQVSQELLSGDGTVIGHTYHYNGNIDGNSDEDLHASITIWNTNKKILTEEEFIAECFYKYLTEKDRYLFNYISDKVFGNYYRELEDSYKAGFDYQSWYSRKMKAADSELAQYKLVFALLLSYDNHLSFTANQLKYVTYKNIVIAFGKKQWNEEKLTIGSCPFKKIRGIILNDTEMNEFNSVKTKISSETLFADGKLKAAASYLDEKSKLEMNVSRALNFQNIGLDVYSSINEKNDDVIKDSFDEAEAESASVIIFPELSINKDMSGAFEKMLNTTLHLKLAVAGSYYRENSDGVFSNVSTIYAKTDGTWNKIVEYSKLIPFTMGYTEKIAKAYGIDTEKYPSTQYKLLTEDIEMNDNTTLLPYKDCVVGIAICRDAMDLLDSHNPLHKYCDFVDVMLVISDNNGDSNMFVGTAECLARWHNCATVYTNSIHEAGTDNPDRHLEIAFALYPYKGSNVSSSTSVSGEINYAAEPFEASDTNAEIVKIIYSAGIKYGALDKNKKCKVYTIKAGN